MLNNLNRFATLALISTSLILGVSTLGVQSANAGSFTVMNLRNDRNCNNFEENILYCKPKTQQDANKKCKFKWDILKAANFKIPVLMIYLNLATKQYDAVLKAENRNIWGHFEKNVCVIDDGKKY